MKSKRLKWMAPALLLAAVAVSCDDAKEPEPSRTLTVSPAETLNFPAEGGTQILAVTAENTAWSAERSDAWIDLDIAADDGRIEVTVGPHDSADERRGAITVSGEGVEPVRIEVVQDGATPSLGVTPSALAFDADGGELRLSVAAAHVDWTVQMSDRTWIDARADAATSEIVVRVEENTDAAPRSGSFLVTGDGVEPVQVEVTQSGAVDFWSRPIAYRMGYKGKVKEVSLHSDLVGNNGSSALLTDLSFDANGNLLAFKRADGAMDVAASYDAQNRLTRIAAKSAGEVDVTLEFVYGEHGKYVPVFELFEDALDILYPVDFPTWIPMLIKDLAQIKVRDALDAENDLDYRYAVTGDTGSLDCYYASGEEYWPHYYDFVFDGAYIRRIDYEGEEYAAYDIDSATGKIRQSIMHYYYEIEITHALDRLNSVTRNYSWALYSGSDERYTYYDYTYIYNDRSDVAAVVDATGSEPELKAEYEYDAQNNWTTITLSSDDGQRQSADREISYWEE